MLPSVMFIILTSLLGPSIICTLFLFYHFIRSPQLRNNPRNYLVICLLIINFVQEIADLPPRLYFLYTQTVPFPYPSFCNFWNWYQFTLTTSNLLIIALGSIERYLLVFNHVFLSQHTLLLRQIPLILCILIPASFYAVSVYAIQCTTVFNYNSVGCGLPCSFYILTVAIIFKNIIFICLPVILTILMSSLLIIRVYIQRRSMQRQREFWKESIKMIVQLLSIIMLYLIIWIPLSVLLYFSTFGTTIQKPIALSLINNIFGNLKYLVNLIYPFLVIIGQSEIHEKIKKIFCCWNPRQITPVIEIPLAAIVNKNINPPVVHPCN